MPSQGINEVQSTHATYPNANTAALFQLPEPQAHTASLLINFVALSQNKTSLDTDRIVQHQEVAKQTLPHIMFATEDFAATAVVTQPTQPKTFFSLPGELRNHIYDILHQHTESTRLYSLRFRYPALLGHARLISLVILTVGAILGTVIVGAARQYDPDYIKDAQVQVLVLESGFQRLQKCLAVSNKLFRRHSQVLVGDAGEVATESNMGDLD
jgi:hypothetical protein